MSGATMGEIIPPVFETKILTNKTTPEFLTEVMGVALKEDVPTKDEVNAKQDKLPYNDEWDVYNVGCWSAVNATRDVNGNWIDETYATKAELPTKTSELDNDSGFLDGSDKDELNERIDLIQATSHPNMNVIGSPTFNQGSVGGFSENDYLMFPTSVNVGNNNVEFHMTFTTGDDVSTQQNILDSWCGLAFAIENGRTILAASTNGSEFNTNTSTLSINPNTSHKLTILFYVNQEGDYYCEALIDGIYYNTVLIGGPLFPTATYWGGANPSSGANHIFGGTINLNECWMSWNGEVVWRGYSELPVPTKVSQLDNDVGYATQAYVDNAIGQVLNEEEF